MFGTIVDFTNIYKQLFQNTSKSFDRPAFFLFWQTVFVFFWLKNIGNKASCKM